MLILKAIYQKLSQGGSSPMRKEQKIWLKPSKPERRLKIFSFTLKEKIESLRAQKVGKGERVTMERFF